MSNMVIRSHHSVVWLLLFLNYLQKASSSTHWVVTEDGRIQSQMDSVFQLRRPDDLVALLQQEERASIVESLKKDLINQKNDIDRNVDEDTNIELELFATEPDCIKAEKPLTELDLYVSTILLFESRGIGLDEFVEIEDIYPPFMQPDCTKIYNLDFSMHTFEHLQAMQLRQNLTILPEKGLIHAVSKSEDVDKFGHNVHHYLVQNNTSWILYNMAVYYWRMVGNAYNALECVRRALHFSPEEYKDISLINLANILHRSQHSDEALIVALIAVENYPSMAFSYFILGNIYTVLTEYNKSVECYANAVKIQPDFDMADKYRHAVLCHSKLEKALEAQHNSLQKTLSELRDYQTRHERWLKYQEKLLNEQASVEARIESRLEYESQKIQQNLEKRGKECFQHQQNGHIFVTCNMHRETYVTAVDSEVDLSLNLKLLHSVESQAEKVEEAVAKQKNLKLQNENSPENLENYTTPTKPMKYPKRDFLEFLRSNSYDFLDLNWPPVNECTSNLATLPMTEEYPSVFLPPENKGFELEKVLGERQGLIKNEEHSLPWYPPMCGKLDVKLDTYDDMQFMSKIEKLNKMPDFSLRPSLFSYIPNSDSTKEEVGQRILTAMKKSLGAPWLLYNLAALYWRINGNVQNGVECLRRSIHSAPPEYLDIPLVNLASLLQKYDFIDDAFRIASTALEVNEYEPETNFLLANIYTMMKNFTGAVIYYKRALIQNPSLKEAKHLLQRVNCYLKIHSSSQHPSVTEVNETPAMCPTLDMESLPITCHNEIEVASIHCYSQLNPQWLNDNEMQGCQKTFSSELSNKNNIVEKRTGKFLNFLHDENTFLTLDDESLKQKEALIRKLHLKISVESTAQSKSGDSKGNPLSSLVEDFKEPVEDDLLPNIIPNIKLQQHLHIPTLEECQSLQLINLKQFTSTWLSVSAKGININEHVIFKSPVVNDFQEPHCDPKFPSSAYTLDHLAGVKHRTRLDYTSEVSLKEAFQMLGQEGDEPLPVHVIATGIAQAMQENSSSWVLPTLAALYWRIKGSAPQAIECLRQALHFAPQNMMDIPLISLANIFHQVGLFNDALIVANMALEISPKFVVIHFTLANIFAAKGELEKALSFYESTLALQSTFRPAKDRLNSIHCQSILSHLQENNKVENT